MGLEEEIARDRTRWRQIVGEAKNQVIAWVKMTKVLSKQGYMICDILSIVPRCLSGHYRFFVFLFFVLCYSIIISHVWTRSDHAY